MGWNKRLGLKLNLQIPVLATALDQTTPHVTGDLARANTLTVLPRASEPTILLRNKSPQARILARGGVIKAFRLPISFDIFTRRQVGASFDLLSRRLVSGGMKPNGEPYMRAMRAVIKGKVVFFTSRKEIRIRATNFDKKAVDIWFPSVALQWGDKPGIEVTTRRK